MQEWQDAERDVWLRSALIGSAHAASRSKDTYLTAYYHRVAARRGKKKAIVALAHRLLMIIYYLPFHSGLGTSTSVTVNKLSRLIRHLEGFGSTGTREHAA